MEKISDGTTKPSEQLNKNNANQAQESLKSPALNQLAAFEATPVEPSPIEIVDVSATKSISAKKVALYTLTVALVLMGLYLLYLIKVVIILFLIAILLAATIEPLVNFLRRGKPSRGQSVLIIYTVIAIVIASLAALIIPILFSQLSTITTTLPQTLVSLQKSFDQTVSVEFIRSRIDPIFEQFKVDTNPNTPSTKPADPQAVVGVVTIVFESFFAILSIMAMSYYWIAERTLIRRVITSLVPLSKRHRVRMTWDDMEMKLGAWVRGQLILCAIIGVAALLGYLAIGGPVRNFAFVLALIAATAEIIPMIGPYLGFGPAVLFALTDPQNGLKYAALTLAYAVFIQMIEGNILVPRVMQKTVGITPLTVVLGMLVGATLMGLVGALLAVPVAGALQVLVQDLLLHRNDLDDEVSDDEDKIGRPTQERVTPSKEGNLVMASETTPSGGTRKMNNPS